MAGEGGGDGFVFSAFGYDSDPHEYGTQVDLYACVTPEGGGTITLRLPPGVTANPGRMVVDPSGDGVVRFKVRLTRGATGKINADSVTAAGGVVIAMTGPVIVRDGDRWRFEPQSP